MNFNGITKGTLSTYNLQLFTIPAKSEAPTFDEPQGDAGECSYGMPRSAFPKSIRDFSGSDPTEYDLSCGRGAQRFLCFQVAIT